MCSKDHVQIFPLPSIFLWRSCSWNRELYTSLSITTFKARYWLMYMYICYVSEPGGWELGWSGGYLVPTYRCLVRRSLRGLNTRGRLPPLYTRETTPVTSCLLFGTSSPFWKGIYSERTQNSLGWVGSHSSVLTLVMLNELRCHTHF